VQSLRERARDRPLSDLALPVQSIQAWALFFLGGLHFSKSMALRAARKAGRGSDGDGLDDASHAIKLLDAAAQRAGAAGVLPCAYWAKTTVVLILLNM